MLRHYKASDSDGLGHFSCAHPSYHTEISCSFSALYAFFYSLSTPLLLSLKTQIRQSTSSCSWQLTLWSYSLSGRNQHTHTHTHTHKIIAKIAHVWIYSHEDEHTPTQLQPTNLLIFSVLPVCLSVCLSVCMYFYVYLYVCALWTCRPETEMPEEWLLRRFKRKPDNTLTMVQVSRESAFRLQFWLDFD